MIKALVFDLGNVLVNFDARKAAKRFAKECHVRITSVWLHFFTSSVEKAYTRGEISSREFYNHSRKALKLPVDYKTFCHYWNDIFWDNEGMDELVGELSKNYPLYLISNTNKLHFDYLKKNHKILRHFKKMFPSHITGCRKPEPEIYRKALAAIKLPPEEVLFIDDIEKFVKGARKVGMKAVRFRGKAQLVKDLRKIGIPV